MCARKRIRLTRRRRQGFDLTRRGYRKSSKAEKGKRVLAFLAELVVATPRRGFSCFSRLVHSRQTKSVTKKHQKARKRKSDRGRLFRINRYTACPWRVAI